jgi:hypothetical protein
MESLRRPAPRKELLYGLVGEVVDLFEPYTEGDPLAIASQFLVGFGNCVGRGPRMYVGETAHYANEYLLLVGKSSRARKGDSRNSAFRPLEQADPDWALQCLAGGLTSGEGIVFHVRDRVERDSGNGPEVVDPGVADKRLCVFEPEFVSVLKAFDRQASTLSPVVRQAWDGGNLRTLGKNSPLRATDAHISIIGHITHADLQAHLTDTEAANGLANRFLILEVHRSKELPIPGRAPDRDVRSLVGRVQDALFSARRVGEVSFADEAAEWWEGDLYRELTRDVPGLFGALTARGEAHVLRLASLYSLLSRSHKLEIPHLEAAKALWDHCAESIRSIFQGRTGNDDADRIIDGTNPGQKVTLTEIQRDIFRGHLPIGRLRRAVDFLVGQDVLLREEEPTRGRPRTILTRLALSPNGNSFSFSERSEISQKEEGEREG